MRRTWNLIICKPATEEGRRELADRVAEVHADSVIRTIRDLDYPVQRKEALTDAIIRDCRR